jgi:hypothetical protein
MTPDDLRNIPRKELVDLVIDTDDRAKAAQRQLAKSDARLAQAEQQLAWFKKQLFGQKSERRIRIESDPKQRALGEALSPEPKEPVATTPVEGHARRKTTRNEDDGESGLRFDPSVPIERIVIPNPEPRTPNSTASTTMIRS